MPDLLTPDIEQLLRDNRDQIGYPPTPDIAGRVLDRIRPAAASRGSAVGLLATTPFQRPATLDALQPIPLTQRRPILPGQLVRLAAAILAFVVVGGLLVAVFSLTGSGDDNQQAAPATETVIQDRLYVLTNIPGKDGQDASGRFTAYNAETREEVYSLDVAYASEVALAPDGSIAYLMQDGLIAVRTADGSLIWRALGADSTVGYISGGPPSMAISADGSLLHLYISRMDDAGNVVGNSVRTIDSNTGTTIREVETSAGANSGCAPQMFASQSNGRIFQTCWTGSRVRIFDLGMERFTYDIELPSRDTIGQTVPSSDSIAGSVQSPDGRYIFVVSDGPRVNVVNTGPGELEATRDIATSEPAPVHRGLLALSDDGTRLAIGIQTVNHDNGLSDVGRIIVVDTATWETVADLNLDPALLDPPTTGQSMAFSPDGSSLYISETEYEAGTVNVVASSSVIKLDIATGAREVAVEATGEQEQIWRVFSGRVSPSPDLAQPDDAWPPRMLLVDFSSDVSGPNKIQVRPVDPDTLDDVSGLQPISVGQSWKQAISPDGRTLAAFTWPTQEREWGALRLLDLETWQTTVAPLTNIGSTSNLSFTEDGQSLYWIAGDYFAGDVVLWRYDIASETASIVTAFPSQFSPRDIQLLDDNRLALYGVPTDSGNLTSGAPSVIVVDLDAGTIVADVVLEGVKAGQYRIANDWEVYRPGTAWDVERGLLYVVHADDDVITSVDLNRGAIVETTAYAPRQSRTDRLLDWLVPSAAAKGGPWTGRQVVLSDDGARLFIAPASDQNNWWREDLGEYPLQVIDTDDLSESRELDLPAISDMRLSPDGRLLVLQTYVHTTADDGQPAKTEQQFIGLAVDDLSQVGAVALPGEGYSLGPSTNYSISGFAADGKSLFAIRRAYDGETQSVELLVVDLEDWTMTVARTFDDSWYGELVVPRQ